MERWRVAFAIVAALAALPLLAIDNVSSTDPEQTLAVSTDDPALELLASRASDWTAAHEAERQEGLDEAIAVAQQVKAEEAAQAAAQKAAEDAAAAAKAKQTEASKKANAAKKSEPQKAESSTSNGTASKRNASTPKPTLAPAVPATTPPRTGDPTAEQWAALRLCEASGSYTAVSANGRFRGAYQFDQATWNHVTKSNFPHLVGVDPAVASPSDQDAVALALYRSRGASPWPRCGRALR